MTRKLTTDEKIASHRDVIAAHMAATTAAFQVLVHCLQENGALDRGQYQEALRVFMETAKHRKDNEIEMALLHDLRMALMD